MVGGYLFFSVPPSQKRTYESRPRNSAWKNSRDPLILEGLHENWTLALRFQVSAQPPAKKTAGLIKNETLKKRISNIE
jgi:hypothetical protein